MFDISSNHSLRNYNKRTFCKTSNVNLLCYKANTISKIKMSLLRIHLISILVVTIFYRTVQSQSTMVPTCGMNNTTDTECILRQVSEQVAHLSAKIDGLQECQAPLNNQNDHATDHVLNTDSFPENCKDIYDLGHVASGVYMIYEPITQSSQFRCFEESMFIATWRTFSVDLVGSCFRGVRTIQLVSTETGMNTLMDLVT